LGHPDRSRSILTEKALTWIIAHFEAGRNFLKRFDLPTLLSLAGAWAWVSVTLWADYDFYFGI
jgi:hypothetical protein